METTEATQVDLVTSIERRTAWIIDPDPENETDGTTRDEAAYLLDAIDGANRRLREAKAKLEEWLIKWLPEHGRELRIGDVRYYVGTKKKVKCRSVAKAIEALMVATGGDYDAFCDTLSTGAIKYGAARKVLGDAYADHFEEIVEQDLEKDAPKKVLNKTDDRFLR